MTQPRLPHGSVRYGMNRKQVSPSGVKTCEGLKGSLLCVDNGADVFSVLVAISSFGIMQGVSATGEVALHGAELNQFHVISFPLHSCLSSFSYIPLKNDLH